MNAHALDTLLAEFVAPPVPAGLAARVAAAALALPQESLLVAARRASARPRHDRRGKWLRRPLLLGGVALGLAVSGALAATLAGVRLDRLPVVEAVLAKLPFVGGEVPPESMPPPRVTPPPPAPPPIESAPAEESRAVPPREPEPPAPRAAADRDDAPPVVAPVTTRRRPEIAIPAPVEMRPPIAPPPPLPAPPPVVRDERIVSAPISEPRAPAPDVATESRLRQERVERIERAERLRDARQAQIERLQRIQQRRERIRRLRRD